MPRFQQVLRQWDLLRRLERAPNGIRISQLVKDDETSRRAVYRDIEALQYAGFPIYNETVDGQKRWMLTETFRRHHGIPLSVSEILALRFARSALEVLHGTTIFDDLQLIIERLDSVLSPEALAFAHHMDQVFVGDRFGAPDYGDMSQMMETLRESIVKQQSVEISYLSQKGQQTTRRVDPYNIWMGHNKSLILIAWCHMRQAIRTFSLSRVKELKTTKNHFEPVEGYDFEAYTSERFRIMAEGRIYRVRIWFAPEAALYVSERTWHPTQTIKKAADGGIELTMEVDGLVELAAWILSFGPRAHVLEPDVLVHRVREELSSALRRYKKVRAKKQTNKK